MNNVLNKLDKAEELLSELWEFADRVEYEYNDKEAGKIKDAIDHFSYGVDSDD